MTNLNLLSNYFWKKLQTRLDIISASPVKGGPLSFFINTKHDLTP